MKTLLLVVANLFFFSTLSWAQKEIPIDVFHEISPGLYRGARPLAQGVEALKKLGIKTIINLESDDAAVREENEQARAAGITMHWYELSGFWAPSTPKIDRILAMLARPELRPLFIHCKYGEDRTGMVVGIYRVEKQGYSPEEAYQEMMDFGFHRELFLLHDYFVERTQYDD